MAELLENEITAAINLAVLKDHDTAGLSGALKNLSHAIVDRPRECHDHFCDSYIADIVAIPGVHAKLRLHIVDTVQGVAVGGPQLLSPDHMLRQEKLLFSTDPVALDRIGCDRVDRVRQALGYPSMVERKLRAPGMKGTPASYIATAAARGLGTDARGKIDVVPVDTPRVSA